MKLGDLKHHVFIYYLHDKEHKDFRAICAGSIIAEDRVLTSAHCFFTNRKRYRRSLKDVRVIAGILTTHVQQPIADEIQQWRTIRHIYTQKFFHFPAYNLAVVEINQSWNFNEFVNKIPYASVNQELEGACILTAVKHLDDWSTNKNLFTEETCLIKRWTCQCMLLQSCRQYYCTQYDPSRKMYTEIEGGGLICHGTGDPKEKGEGIVVGVTSLINVGLPSLHNRVGLYHKWITDRGSGLSLEKFMFHLCFGLILVSNKVVFYA
ncbi:unnamed protein product [Parnassius mnemosyne]|uniref:Peptidase S1 domain-containing protein n=1 Tax=Parnassius mnemosyne TaxID=213953 RepID=A0AAV1KTR7_9NEOP